MEQEYCDINGRRIPIVMEDRQGCVTRAATRKFAGGNGSPPAGDSFWAVMAGPVPLFVFRAIDGRPVEDRLHDHGGMTARQIELLQKFAARIVPATSDEIKLGLSAHPEAASLLEGVE